jgi:hypothetical protein
MRSCSSSVLVKQTAEQVTPADLGRLIVADEGRSGSWVRRLKAKRPVRPMGVVVLNVDSEHLLEVAASDVQQPVQALGAHRPDPALGVSVRVGGPHRRQEHLGALGAEQIIEGAGELRVPVAQREAQPPSSFAKHQQEVAGLLGDPGAIWVGGHSGEVDASGVHFDEEQHVQPPQPHRVDGEAGRRPRSRRPAGARTPARS